MAGGKRCPVTPHPSNYRLNKTHLPTSTEKLSSMKPVPDARKVGDRCSRAMTTESTHLKPVLCNKRSHSNEKPAYRDREWALLAATREGPHAVMKTQHSQK